MNYKASLRIHLMGGARRAKGPVKCGSGKFPEPLVDMFSVGATEVSVDKLIDMTIDFAREKRGHHDLILKAERAIHEIYGRFEETQRVIFLARLYDRFSENYDAHMGEHTGHYRAIDRVLGYAKPYLELPIIDLSAGTGQPMKYAMGVMGSKVGWRIDSDLTYLIHVNELSQKMLAVAERKLGKQPRVGYTDYNAYELPDHLKGRFRSVLCSQTFHIISDADKIRLVNSMREVLLPGGYAVVVEEDPFRITQTPSIEPVSLFLRSVVAPIKNPGKLIGYFITHGFRRVEESAESFIDSEHSMKLHIFQKS